jgi:hypothetical protein
LHFGRLGAAKTTPQDKGGIQTFATGWADGSFAQLVYFAKSFGRPKADLQLAETFEVQPILNLLLNLDGHRP